MMNACELRACGFVLKNNYIGRENLKESYMLEQENMRTFVYVGQDDKVLSLSIIIDTLEWSRLDKKLSRVVHWEGNARYYSYEAKIEGADFEVKMPPDDELMKIHYVNPKGDTLNIYKDEDRRWVTLRWKH
jgi:hypothetical protein